MVVIIELITDMKDVSRLLNTNVPKKFLSIALNYDGYKTVAPKVVRIGSRNVLLTRHIELGNVEGMKKIEKTIPAEMETVYYNTYFGFEPFDTGAYPEFLDAYESVAGDEKDVLIHRDMPVAVYQWLEKKYKPRLAEGEKENAEFYRYEVTRQQVLDRFNVGREQADKIALRLIAKSPLKKELEPYITGRTDTRFSALDKLMKAEGLDTILCTSPLGVQEITGFGITRHADDEVAALYTLGSDKVWLFSAQPLDDFGPGRKVLLAQAVKERVGQGVLGLEEQHLSIGWLKGLGLEEMNVKNAMTLVRYLREVIASENLSYCIIAVRASVYATDESLAWAKKEVMAGKTITELDIDEKYQSLLKEFRQREGIPFAINTFWTNCHAAKRSLIPSLAYNYPVDKSAKSVKIDAGVSIIGNDGIHYAASDIARTILFEDDAQKTYDKFEEFMVKDIIPKIKPGMSGREIHAMVADTIEKERAYFEALGMIPEGSIHEIFNRDVGHLMGLQEPVTMFFTKNSEAKLVEGMIGALEYQWVRKGFGIGVEDLFVVGLKGGLNFSRDDL